VGVKKSIFGSRGEAEGFDLIERTWGEDYRLFSNIPFALVFDPEPEWDTSHLFFKTSIDYVLCTKKGRPLLGIDFDGLGGGFDKAGVYKQIKETPADQHRKVKFDFKLRHVAKHTRNEDHSSIYTDFPYHIVASDEFQDLDDNIALTVVDGIIGNWLARKDFTERAQSVLDEHSDEIRGIPAEERGEAIDSLLFDEEYDTHLRHNPIISKRMEIMHQIAKLSDDDMSFIGGASEPVKVAEGWTARKYTLSHKDVGEVSATAVLRDSSWAHMIFDIAQLLAYSKLLRRVQERQPTG